MSKALELAGNTEQIQETQTKDGRFVKGDPRTREAGRKGGKAPHANGSKTGMTYRYKGFTISWDKTRHLWKGTDGAATLYERSHHKLTAAIKKHEEEKMEFIETPIGG